MPLRSEALEERGFPVFTRRQNAETWLLTVLNPIEGYPAMPVLIQPEDGLTMNVAVAYGIVRRKKAVLRICNQFNAENSFAHFVLDEQGTLLLEYDTAEEATDALVLELLCRFSLILRDAMPCIFRTLYGGMRHGA